MQTFVLLLLVATVAPMLLLVVSAQNYPPRLSIPGAVPVGGGGRPQFRNEKLVRVRRPTALRQQSQNALAQAPPAAPIAQRIQHDEKPVTEAPEDDNLPDVYLPQLLREQQLAQVQQQQFQQTASAFFNSEPGLGSNVIHETPISHLLQQHEEIGIAAPSAPPTRFPERAPSAAPSARPAFNDYGIGSFSGNNNNNNNGGAQRFNLERERQQAAREQQPQPQQQQQLHHQQQQIQQQQQPQQQQQQRVNIVRSRPAPVPAPAPRPQYEAQSAPAPQRPRPKQPIQSRPQQQHIAENQLQQQDEREQQTRPKRPVAQTLRKWREENEDGSITWGYENDDGSFKEEIIGTDCVTKGTYGYIDPDNNKREYHYETGIKCDPNTRETEEELQENGFINYEENKAVLPNGIEVDMSQLGKKKSKRPGAAFRN